MEDKIYKLQNKALMALGISTLLGMITAPIWVIWHPAHLAYKILLITFYMVLAYAIGTLAYAYYLKLKK